MNTTLTFDQELARKYRQAPRHIRVIDWLARVLK